MSGPAAVVRRGLLAAAIVLAAGNPRRRRWGLLPSMRKARGGIAAAAIEGGPRPGFHFSAAIEYLDVR